MRVIGNCVVASVLAWVLHPASTKVVIVRNRAGRLHCAWERDGVRYEFYAPGRSKLPYWRNAFYLGKTRKMGRAA